MRRLIVRTTLYAVLVAALVVAVPALAALVWVVTSRPALVTIWMAQPAGTRAFQLCVTATVLVAVAVAVTLGLVHGRAQRIAEPMTRLAEAAERLGEGPARLEPLASGIPEVDGVSAVLSRSAQQVTRSLSAERQFAADASHQLRTPLTALLMRLEEISESADLDVVHEEAGIAINQVERLTRVVDDLSMRSRRSNDAPRPEVSLDSVIAALQREWQPAFEQARRSVRVHGERGLVVRATPVALSQVLSTLLENSLVHGRGTVDLEARRSGPSVVVEVSDQGDGVSPTIAPHIFERSVSSGEGKSTGLGLALARDLAESNGGRLDLVSAQPVRFALFLSEADPR
ncbi:MAG: HAMP domain-containing histidine kinase [Actinomycetota bacterium]|nr:HAMP domain-containing histidine kinase [Actinomycetota bacterium]